MGPVSPFHHQVDLGDSPNPDLAKCMARGCKFSFRHPNRNVRLAAAYRHIADLLDPPKETDA